MLDMKQIAERWVKAKEYLEDGEYENREQLISEELEHLKAAYIDEWAEFFANAIYDVPEMLLEISRLNDIIKESIQLPCKVGDTVYVITTCEHLVMYHDDDYFTGTGAVDCPYEGTCEYEDCESTEKRVFAAECTGFLIEGKGKVTIHIENVDFGYLGGGFWGIDIFSSKEEADAVLKKED